ncbi:hypothetical protein DUNSADRAFT_1097, partial [Dunaliella salina]
MLEQGAEQAAIAATHMAVHALNEARAIHQAARAQRPPPSDANGPGQGPSGGGAGGAAASGLQTPPLRPRVLNARAASPSPSPLQLPPDASRTRPDREQSAASTVTPWDCQQLATLLNTWLRLGTRAMGLLTPGVLAQVSDNLATALLVAVQIYGDRLDTAGTQPAEHMGLQAVLLDLLPQLSKSVSAGTLNTALGTQVMLELVSHHLPAADWLPVVKAHLNLQAMLVQAASQAPAALSSADAKGAASEVEGAWAGGQGKSLGMLQLALAVARVPEGARWMLECGVLDFL